MHARRLLSADLSPDALEKMITDIAPSFKDRQGGYTRIVRLGNRFSDNASMVIMEWMERAEVVREKVSKPVKKVKAVKAKPVVKKKVKKQIKTSKKVEKKSK
ncbi:MAG: 50S ribosomal protein L17 [Candidatus Levybacteria bacterium GW2011_GWC1_40_19]|nr:MAG: 50S ribosomal protein L17 [Candidatus Levybacteria bacterium GW2011_GWC1_40_19]